MNIFFKIFISVMFELCNVVLGWIDSKFTCVHSLILQ